MIVRPVRWPEDTARLIKIDTSFTTDRVWIETQNINYPAIQFYRKCGFTLCGLDENLYHPKGPGANEIALFFAKPIS